MAFQMVYTSVRSGLVAGRSGFCTAARHREIKESLVARLEDFSTQYDRGIAAGGTLPVVYQHRIVAIRDQRHHVLMRLGDAGNDYTGRTNHIAHCLVVEPSEIAGLSISPAEAILALSQRGFWRSHYDEPAQFFGAGDLIDLGTLPRSASLPATRWRDRSGSSANAAQLFESGGPVDASLAVSGTGEADAAATLALFAESVLLLDPDRSSGTALWSVPFTTVLQSSAERSQFRWCGIVADGPLIAQESRAGRKLISLSSTPFPPTGAFADLAEGRAPRLEMAVVVGAVVEQPTAGIAAGVAYPREPALGSNPSTGVVQERPAYAVPLSLEDPRYRQRAVKSSRNTARTAVLCAAAVLLIVAMAGGFVRWSASKEVREKEKEIEGMVEGGKWEEIHKRLNDDTVGKELLSRSTKLLSRSTKLKGWKQAASAIDVYSKVKTNPQDYSELKRGIKSINDIVKCVEESEPKAGTMDSNTLVSLNSEKERAQESIKLWNETREQMKVEFGYISELSATWNTAKIDQRRNGVSKIITNIESSQLSSEAKDQLKGPLLVLKEEIFRALEGYSQIRYKHESEETFKDAKGRAEKISKDLLKAIEDLDSKNPRKGEGIARDYEDAIEACKSIVGYEGKIKLTPTSPAPQTPAPPKPDPAVTAAAEAKKEKVPPKTILVRPGSDGLIDLSGIDGAPSDLPETVEIFPLSSLVPIDGIEGHLSTRSGSRGSYSYYDGKRKVILRNPGELKLKKGEGAEFWEPFPGGFILHFPKDGEGGDDVRYLVLDAIPEDQGSTSSSPFMMMPGSSFLNRLASGEVALSEDVARVLARTEVTGGGSLKYRLILAGGFPLASDWVEDPSGIMLPLAAKVREELSRIKPQKERQERAAQARKYLESSYANLGKDLFPQFFESDPGVGEKVIVKKKNPREREHEPNVAANFPDFIKSLDETELPARQIDRFTKYVADLFKQLKELAGDEPRHAEANGEFERLIDSLGKIKPRKDLTLEAAGWIEVTNLIKEKKNKWGESAVTPITAIAQTKANEDQFRKDFQKRYFDDFFRVWNERFSEEAVNKLIGDFNLIESTQALPSLEQLDSALKVLEAMKSRLENDDLSDDGEYTLELLIETPTEVSPESLK
jgi:hypothetical protein